MPYSMVFCAGRSLRPRPPPAISVRAPATPVTGTATLNASAVDDRGVVAVRFLVNGTQIVSLTRHRLTPSAGIRLQRPMAMPLDR